MLTVNCTDFDERSTTFQISKDIVFLSHTFSNMLEDLADPDDSEAIFNQEIPMILSEGGTCQNAIDLFKLVQAMHDNDHATINDFVNIWTENPALINGFLLVNNYVDISYTQYFTENGEVVTDYNKNIVKSFHNNLLQLYQFQTLIRILIYKFSYYNLNP